MPGYFAKDDLQDDYYQDALYDLEVFCEAVSPLFHIKKRFVGEEPQDHYTGKYNEQMSKLLPMYHIDFEVIPRYELYGKPVSGSRCRELYKAHEWEELKKYVPASTLDVLKSNAVS